MVKLRDSIPDITVTDQNDQSINLRNNIGHKMIIYFYPKDNTPGCTKESCSFRDEFTVLQDKGFMIYGVSKDSIDSHRKFRENYKLPFPLLSDPKLELTKAFGAYGKKPRGGTGLIRSTFVIDKEGKILSIYGLSGFPKVKTATHAQDILNDLN